MEQHAEVCKAVIGAGQCSLNKDYESLSNDWFMALNDEQWKNPKRKFQEVCVKRKMPWKRKNCAHTLVKIWLSHNYACSYVVI